MKWMILLFTMMAFACNPKNTVNNTTSNDTEEVQEAVDESLIIGVIEQATSRTGCEWTIKVKAVNYLLDPINLDKEFMQDGLKVRLKYRQLRMQNRCKEANPVEIEKMTLL